MDDFPDQGTGDDGSALLIIRAWAEGGKLRARVTEVTALSGPEQHLAVETTVEATCARVLAWLTRFVEGPRPRPLDGVRGPRWNGEPRGGLGDSVS